jgi:tol-pal system protein YbgF
MLIITFGVYACSTSKSLKETDTERLEGKLDNMDRKFEEMHQILSAIQIRVDSQQKSLETIASFIDQESKKHATSADTEPSVNTADTPPKEITETEKQTAESAETLYHRGLVVYQQKDYEKAAALFGAVEKNYPDHDLSDNALYWAGECQYAQKDYHGAIAVFKKVINNYPEGGKVPDAMLKIGYSYLLLGDRENARSVLKEIVKQYPFTPAGTKAGKTLNKIKTN